MLIIFIRIMLLHNIHKYESGFQNELNGHYIVFNAHNTLIKGEYTFL